MKEFVYNELLYDSFLGVLFFAIHEEYVLKLMLLFGNYDHGKMMLFAFFGGTFGLILNYLLGVGVFWFANDNPNFKEKFGKRYERIQKFSNKYLIWGILITSTIPYICGIIAFFAGTIKVRLTLVFIFFAAGRLCYYYFLIY